METMKRAARAFERFTGHRAEHYTRVRFDPPRPGEALTYIGPVVAITYEATRDGETAHYEHEFRKSSRPVLAASSDGKRLYLLAGAYRFTSKGIVDA